MAQKSGIINYLPRKHEVVKVIGNDDLVQNMFRNRGYKVIDDYKSEETPDLVCFTGGADVSPHLYGQENVACGGLNEGRDKREVAAYNAFIDIPKVGICRGGQLLNVLSGGRMWQHVDKQGGNHDITDLLI
jgi:gamma-glutamyl-gamma-aminobutyrate hydrolase PuuD